MRKVILILNFLLIVILCCSCDKKVEESESGHNLITQQEEVMALIHALPEAEDVKRLMENLGAPVYPSQIDVTDENVINACVYAKELRERVGLLQVLHDLGLAKSYGERVIRGFCK